MNVYYIGGYPVSDELYHHGILGQKWGVRRYQNEDGTLTSAGRERYRKSIARGEKLLNKKPREKTLSEATKTRIKTGARTGIVAALADHGNRQGLTYLAKKRYTSAS